MYDCYTNIQEILFKLYLPAFFLDFDLVPLSCPLTSCNLFSNSAFFFAVSTGESFNLLTATKIEIYQFSN